MLILQNQQYDHTIIPRSSFAANIFDRSVRIDEMSAIVILLIFLVQLSLSNAIGNEPAKGQKWYYVSNTHVRIINLKILQN